ncbi:hypothetical protein [Vibrio crassostreae]|uniref:hypothetical protein n=1 Tax=Vibrio crassostreae TaxID=246167 RepID=UPI001B308E36|nr:hypothetical protein [Vibrio crassostreae]
MDDLTSATQPQSQTTEPKTRDFLNVTLKVLTTLLATIPLVLPSLINLNPSSYLKALMFWDGLTWFQTIAFSLAMITLFFILRKTKSLARNNKRFSKARVYIEQSLMLVMLIVFSAFLTQVFAPHYSLTSYFIERDKSEAFSRIKSVQGVEFELMDCIQELRQIRCIIQISNQNKGKVSIKGLTYNEAYSFDGQSIEFERAIVGGNSVHRRATKVIAPRSYITSEIFFTTGNEGKIDVLKDLTITYKFLEYNKPISFANITLKH